MKYNPVKATAAKYREAATAPQHMQPYALNEARARDRELNPIRHLAEDAAGDATLLAACRRALSGDNAALERCYRILDRAKRRP